MTKYNYAGSVRLALELLAREADEMASKCSEQPPEQALVGLSSDGAAAVDRNYHWLPTSPETPRGVKLQLINRPDGVAFYGTYKQGDRATHYQRLPTFTRET